jgi:hypothetical protein
LRDLTVTLQRRTPVINVMSPEYAGGAVGNFTTDDRAAIQAAIDACQTAGGGYVYFPCPSVAYGILDSVNLKPGVMLLGEAAAPGYFDGWDSYLGSANTGTTCRIKAQSGFHSGTGLAGLIELDVATTTAGARAKGYGITNLVLDGNAQAERVIKGLGSSFIERVLTLDNATVMRSFGDGGLATSNIMLRVNRSKFVGNAGYGVLVTVTDSYFADNYIHSNAGGGIAFNSGSTHNTIIGGKVEENFGYGVEVFCGGSSTSEVNMVGVDLQHNTKSGIVAHGGGSVPAYCKATACVLGQNGYASTLGDGAQVQSDAAGRVVLDSTSFVNANVDPPKYHIGATNSGKLWHRNSVYINTAATANTYTATSGVITADTGSLTTIA